MRLFYLLLFVCLGAVSCTPANPGSGEERVLLNRQHMRLVLSPSEAPVETPLTLTVTADDISMLSGELTGVSMYMGRVPLRFSKQTENQWQAVFLLGACSDPDMQWQLVLHWQDAQGKNHTVKQQFQSSWQ